MLSLSQRYYKNNKFIYKKKVKFTNKFYSVYKQNF